MDFASPNRVEPAEAEEAEAPLRVLLVEDHPTNQRVVRLMLDAYDVELTITENGQEGLDAWQAGGFDVILMDMQMPVMDGLSAIRAIRAAEREDPRRGRTPVAMLSANAMEHHKRQSLEAGADLHIAKPVSPAELVAGMEAAMEAARSAAAA